MKLTEIENKEQMEEFAKTNKPICEVSFKIYEDSDGNFATPMTFEGNGAIIKLGLLSLIYQFSQETDLSGDRIELMLAIKEMIESNVSPLPFLELLISFQQHLGDNKSESDKYDKDEEETYEKHCNCKHCESDNDTISKVDNNFKILKSSSKGVDE